MWGVLSDFHSIRLEIGLENKKDPLPMWRRVFKKVQLWRKRIGVEPTMDISAHHWF